jgi:Tfp pilus assembly protein PilO
VSARGKEVYIIAGVVAVVLIVAWYFLLLSPTRAKISDLTTQAQGAQSALASVNQEVTQLQAAKKTAPQTRAEIVRLGKMLPDSEGIPSLIVELTHTSGLSGVTVSSITRGETHLGSPFGLQAVTLQLTGSYFDVEDFLYRVENYVAFRNASFRVTGRLLDVNALTLTTAAVSTSSTSSTSSTTTSSTASTTPELTVTVGLSAYLWSGTSASASGASSSTAGG